MSEYEVVVRLDVSSTVVANVAPADTCSRYDVAPEEAFHVSVGLSPKPVDPSFGLASTGGAGTAPVVKLETLEYPLVPMAFVALTRQ